MAKQDPTLDALFQALADPTRRAVLAHLVSGPAPISDLAAPHDMALPSFLRHITVLEEAGLITSRKSGRVRTCKLAPARLREIEAWLIPYRPLWTREKPRYSQLAKSLYAKPSRT